MATRVICRLRAPFEFRPSVETRRDTDSATPSGLTHLGYGVRPRRTSAFGDQLGLDLGRKSKIEDGHAGDKVLPSSTTVADF